MNKVIKVLSIEDSPSDEKLIQIYLEQAPTLGWDLPRFNVIHVTTLAEGLERLSKAASQGDRCGTIDVVLCDLDLPDSNPSDTFGVVHAAFPDLPIVVLTGSGDSMVARDTVRTGAEDYLFKDEVRGPLLAHAIIYALERRQIRRALQGAHDELERRVQQRTTELRQANAELRASEEKFRTLFNNAADAIFIHDLEGHFLEVNQEAIERLGYSREEFLTMTPLDIDGPQDALRFQERLEVTESQKENLVEVVHVTKDGREIPVELKSRVIRYNGRSAILTIARDVTRRREAERALIMNEAKYRGVLEWSTDGIIITDDRGQIVDWNPAAEKIFGRPARDVLERLIWDVQFEAAPPEQQSDAAYRRLRAMLQSFLETGQAAWHGKPIRTLIRRPDGSRRIVEANTFSLPLGREVRAVSIVRDLTEEVAGRPEPSEVDRLDL
jgi:PAS domain S-box-containing protein